MAFLSAAQTSEFAARLQWQRAALLDSIRKVLLASADPQKRGLANHPEQVLDWIESNHFADTETAMLGSDLAGLRDTDAALERIADGIYGVCTNCGEPIALERLNQQPAARLCLACKEDFKRRRGIV